MEEIRTGVSGDQKGSQYRVDQDLKATHTDEIETEDKKEEIEVGHESGIEEVSETQDDTQDQEESKKIDRKEVTD